MGTIAVKLPAALKAFIDEQVAKGEYRDASAFVQALLVAEVQRRVRRQVEQLLLEAVDGPFEQWTEQDVEDIRRHRQ